MDVAVLGASPNPARYANKAIRSLLAHGHTVVPVNPGHATIEGLPVLASLDDLKAPVHTITVYVGPTHVAPLIDAIVRARPQRVILNPGAESEALEARLRKEGIPVVEACTLVMLATGQF